MLGQLGEVAMSASSLANQVGFIFMMINFGLTGGAGVLTSQYWGRGDADSIRKVMSLTYRISMSIALIFAIGATFFPEMLMRIFTNDEAIIYEGTAICIIAESFIWQMLLPLLLPVFCARLER